MNRYRNAPTLRGPSKASANTLCQKCLKRDIYECKATAQERPYKPRPSRTQQLQNPHLMPKLSNEVPNDLQRTDTAGETDAKREEERGRKRELDGEYTTDRYGRSPKRARSLSSHSISSVSTISTNRTASVSPDRSGKRNSHDDGRRTSPVSPRPKTRKRRYSDASQSSSSYSSGARHRSRSREWSDDRNIRRRRRESSPKERGRHRDTSQHSRRGRRSRSMDQSRITKERRSMTPDAVRGSARQRPYRDREGPSDPTFPSQPGRSRPDTRVRPEPPRQRSLSPFSKRLALTQAMNLGR